MAKWTLKASKEDIEAADSQAEFEHAPPGYYICTIDEMSHGPGKEGKDGRAVVILKPVSSFKEGERFPLDGNYSRLWDYISDGESSGWKRAQFGKALGIPVKRGVFQEGIEMEKGKPGTVIGREVLVRIKKDADLEGNYRGKVGNYLPKEALDEVVVGGTYEEEPDEEGTEEDDTVDIDFEALGESADADGEDAQTALTEYAAGQKLDPDDFETWLELANAIAEAIDSGEQEEEEGEEEPADEDLYTEESLTAMDKDQLTEAAAFFDLVLADYVKKHKANAKVKLVEDILAAQNGDGEEDPF